ncbi:MAG TPA: ketoacyl-ACP synthase III, partial [Gammaproteobacteria bacterium]|nr:ketoacyl-ACP synthase III [Gammaproteobacteria bacterium]
AELAKVEIAKAPSKFKELGNLTSASIAVTLDMTGTKESDRILILGSGSGLSISQIGLVL